MVNPSMITINRHPGQYMANFMLIPVNFPLLYTFVGTRNKDWCLLHKIGWVLVSSPENPYLFCNFMYTQDR